MSLNKQDYSGHWSSYADYGHIRRFHIKRFMPTLTPSFTVHWWDIMLHTCSVMHSTISFCDFQLWNYRKLYYLFGTWSTSFTVIFFLLSLFVWFFFFEKWQFISLSQAIMIRQQQILIGDYHMYMQHINQLRLIQSNWLLIELPHEDRSACIEY